MTSIRKIKRRAGRRGRQFDGWLLRHTRFITRVFPSAPPALPGELHRTGNTIWLRRVTREAAAQFDWPQDGPAPTQEADR